MKFWQKIFLSSIFIFVAAFNIGAYILVSYSYNFSSERETQSSIREQTVISSSINTSINNLESLLPNSSKDKDILTSIIKPLADYYKEQDVYLALYNDKELIYSNTPQVDEDILSVNDGKTKVSNQSIQNKRYLFISSKITDHSHLCFVYVKNISTIDMFRINLSKIYVIISVVIMTVLAVVYSVLLKKLTKPIKELNAITSEIAGGAYGQRVHLSRKDEFGELSKNFNIMADSIEEKIDELTEQTENKQQFIDNLTHEMKTPLTSILGYCDYLKNAMSNEEQRIKAADYIHKSAVQLSNLSAKLLEIMVLTNNEINCSHVNIDSLFNALKVVASPLLAVKNLSLETNSMIQTIYCDETLLLSVLINLVDNAAHASREEGIIRIRAYKEVDTTIEIIDNGCGMDTKELNKITQPFYRVDTSRSRENGGVGLGLSIVKKIADLHGARIEISTKLNEGTSIKIIFYKSITT